MIVPIAALPNQPPMGAESEQFNRGHYQTTSYDNENCYSNSESADTTSLQYRDWEMRVYNQMHGNGANDTDYFLAARKVQENYPYTPSDVASYPTYTGSEYMMGYPNPAHHPAAVYYGEMAENLYYTQEQLAAQQYYHQHQPAVNGDLYYTARHHPEAEEFVGGYDSTENLSYQSTGSSGRPSPHQHYDRSSMPSSPECHKFATLYVQSPNGGIIQRNDNAALLCAVCGDNAACQHYGVRTCEGCKGFFKRTVQKKSKYVCLAEKKCPIDKRRRNRCQFCRFQKCLAVGMVKEVVRSDSLKGRRGRLPSKPKSPSDKPVSPPLPLITTLVRAHMEQSIDVPNVNFVCDYSTEKEMVIKLLEHLTQNANIIKTFFTRGNGAFSELLADDKDRISQLRCFHFFLLRLAQRMKVTVDVITLPNGTMYHRSQLQGILGEILIGIADFAVELQRSEIDMQSFACVLILSVLNYKEKAGIKAPAKIESAASKVLDSLRDHCTYNPEAQNQPHLYTAAMTLIDRLNNHCQHMLARLNQYISEQSISVPSQIACLFTQAASSLPATTTSNNQL